MQQRHDAPALRPDWPAPLGVHALTTFRHCADAGRSAPPFDSFNLGNCRSASGDDPRVVAANRARLVECFALPAAPCWLNQVHGTTVWRIPAPTPGPEADGPEADAAVTAGRGVVLAVLTADCLPVLFCADDGSEVAAAHAGWRGLAAGVLEATLASMRTPPPRVLAWLGPAAGPRAYEVGDEVRDGFIAVDPAAADAFVATRPGHWACDLYRLARQRLARVGITRVFGGDRCTISEPARFFSHRRDGRSGRMASLIWRD